MPTIQDIAKLAGVTKSTVSRYLNGGSVSEKTAAKIEKVIKEVNYIPSPFARSLKAKSSTIIGVIVPRVDSAATAHTLMGIDEVAEDLGYELLIANARQNNQREIQAIEQFTRYKVAGIILIATEITEEHVQALKQAGIPAILVGQQHAEFHSVVHDDYQAGYQLAQQLVEQGYSHLTYVGVSPRDYSVGVVRKKGVCDGAQSAGVQELTVVEGDFTIAKAVQIGEDLFNTPQRQLVIAATDNIAVGLMRAAHDRQLQIPEDVAIAGFGGYEISRFMNPTLTTVQYDFNQAGCVAVRMMDAVLKKVECPQLQMIPTEVVLRESTRMEQK